jgi:hypothetical protein
MAYARRGEQQPFYVITTQSHGAEAIIGFDEAGVMVTLGGYAMSWPYR